MFADSGDGDVESLIDLLLPCLFYRLQVAEFLYSNSCRVIGRDDVFGFRWLVDEKGKIRFQIPGKAMYFQALRFKIYCRGRQVFVVLWMAGKKV